MSTIRPPAYPLRMACKGPRLTSLKTNGVDALEETLSRLSKKPGVKATIALDRSSGAILKTAGQISLLHTSKSQQQQQATQPEDPNGADDNNGNNNETQGAEELAGMVWAFVNAAGGLVEGLDAEVSERPVFYGAHRWGAQGEEGDMRERERRSRAKTLA